MRTFGRAGQWDGGLRLAWVVVASAAFAVFWVFQQGGSSWPTRLWGALLAACAPIVVAWPLLARLRRRSARPRHGSLDELNFLRRSGAI